MKKKSLPAVSHAGLLTRRQETAAARGADALVLQSHRLMLLMNEVRTSGKPVRIGMQAAILLGSPAGRADRPMPATEPGRRAYEADEEYIGIEYDSMSWPMTNRPHRLSPSA